MSMHNTQRGRTKRRGAGSRALLIAAAVALFAGLFVQITMLSRISSQNKLASELQDEITDLTARAQNLELSINQYHDLSAIEIRAQRLGMEKAEDTQLRVVSVARSGNENTSIQTAGVFGGEKVLN